jgi:hypothetical protein
MDALKAVGAFLSGKRGPTFEAFRGPSVAQLGAIQALRRAMREADAR